MSVYVIGTCDTKHHELRYVCERINSNGLESILVNIGIRGGNDHASISAYKVAESHPEGGSAVFLSDRGQSITAMSVALQNFILRRTNIEGIIGLGGGGGSAMIAPALQALPIGLPKVLVSTLASGDVSSYVGISDIVMFHSVTDIAGLNSISRKILSNAANAISGMVRFPAPKITRTRPSLGLTMFGVTTPAVKAITSALENENDCLVFHPTGTGGRAMEKLAADGALAGVLDITTTEIADELCGGVLSAGAARLDVLARSNLPYLGSCGALDIVNFLARDTIPERYQTRLFYQHNAHVTLMRTSAEECADIGQWIAQKLNSFRGPVRFVVPLGGFSALDKDGQPFWAPDANKALITQLKSTLVETANRRIIEYDGHINDPEFAELIVLAWKEIASQT